MSEIDQLGDDAKNEKLFFFGVFVIVLVIVVYMLIVAGQPIHHFSTETIS